MVGAFFFYYNKLKKGGVSMYNPYQMPQAYGYGAQNQPVRAENNLIRVTGIDGAKAYQMAPNSTVALFDSGDDLMYVKTTDGAGFGTIRTFRFEPIEQAQAPATDYITREEFETWKQEVLNGKQLISDSKSKSKPAKSDE